MDKIDRFRDVKKVTVGANLCRFPRITNGGGVVLATGFSAGNFKRVGGRTRWSLSFYEGEGVGGEPISPSALKEGVKNDEALQPYLNDRRSSVRA